MDIPVFASRVSGLGDARYFSGMGVRWLGIVAVANQPGYLSPGRFREIAGWVAGVEFILEVDGAGPAVDFRALTNAYGTGKFLIHPDQADAAISFGVSFGIRCTHDSDVSSVKGNPDFLLIQSADSDQGEHHNYPILLSAGLSKDKLEVWLSLSRQHGIWVTGSAEEKPGLKEYPAADVLEWLDEQ